MSFMRQQKLLRLLKEMLKDSKRSDREIAKSLGVSQPTVTRTRAQLEKEYIETYTVIPDFETRLSNPSFHILEDEVLPLKGGS
jgi:DNA-binding Lrp family transcriptional regulator